MIKTEQLPGIALLVLVSIAAMFASETVEVAGKHPIEASALAIVFGLLATNFLKLPASFKPGIKFGEKMLALGIVLMGAGLRFDLFASRGLSVFGIIVLTMTFGMLATYYLGRLLNLQKALSFLLAVGTSICGGTAIAVIAPIMKAKEEDVAYAVGVISLWGLVALLTYPLIGLALGVSDLQFGVFAGTAIHSTPQVVGAGYLFSEVAGQTATAVKLIRNCFIAPLALLVAAVYSKTEGHAGAGAGKKAFPWFLFGYFALAGLAELGLFSPQTIDRLVEAGKFLILTGMAGVGLSTQLKNLISLGLKPLLLGLFGAVAVGALSSLLIRFWL